MSYYIHRHEIRDYWKRKRKFTARALDNNGHRWLSKWMTGICGVGVMLVSYKHQDHSKCPRCQILNLLHTIYDINHLRTRILENDGTQEFADLMFESLNA